MATQVKIVFEVFHFSLKGLKLFFYELKHVFLGQQSYAIEIPGNIVAIYPIRLSPLISAHCVGLIYLTKSRLVWNYFTDFVTKTTLYNF